MYVPHPGHLPCHTYLPRYANKFLNRLHEFGHTFGLGHSEADGYEYGDSTDPMGSARGAGFSSVSRYSLGWIASSTVLYLPLGGFPAHLVELQALGSGLPQDSPPYSMVHVPCANCTRGSSTRPGRLANDENWPVDSPLFLSYRGSQGSDAFLGHLQHSVSVHLSGGHPTLAYYEPELWALLGARGEPDIPFYYKPVRRSPEVKLGDAAYFPQPGLAVQVCSLGKEVAQIGIAHGGDEAIARANALAECPVNGAPGAVVDRVAPQMESTTIAFTITLSVEAALVDDYKNASSPVRIELERVLKAQLCSGLSVDCSISISFNRRRRATEQSIGHLDIDVELVAPVQNTPHSNAELLEFISSAQELTSQALTAAGVPAVAVGLASIGTETVADLLERPPQTPPPPPSVSPSPPPPPAPPQSPPHPPEKAPTPPPSASPSPPPPSASPSPPPSASPSPPPSSISPSPSDDDGAPILHIPHTSP